MRFQDLGKRGVLQNLDPVLIVEEPGWNQRQETPALIAHIETLAGSIKSIGVIEPLTAYMRGDEVVLVNGHCRLAAVRKLLAEGHEVKLVPVRVEPHTANDADRVLSMVTRNSGKPLEPIEVANVFKQLLAFGWSVAEIAAKSGYSDGRVSQLLQLNAAPEKVKGMISRGEVAATTAAKVLQESGPVAGAAILEEAVTTAKANGKKKASGKHLPKGSLLTPKDFKKRIKELEQAVLDVLKSECFYSEENPEFADRLKSLVRGCK